MKPVEWIGGANGHLRLLDQTLLPGEVAGRDCRDVPAVIRAIQELAVRGAPAIGVAAAYGAVLAGQSPADMWEPLLADLRSSRPTAVNLMWACDRMARVQPRNLERLLAEARAIEAENADMCRAIAEAGAKLLPASGGVITHCNTGPLATADHGTALGAILVAHAAGARFHVYVDETRPLLQGARLTTWELTQARVPHTLICDNAAGLLMRQGRIHAAIVGADRIAANGDTANKIGTYGLAVLARHHGVPFVVAAPTSTFDLSLADGASIPIEERSPAEVMRIQGRVVAPETSSAWNPAFDVTPAELITAIVTERGVIRPVSAAGVAAVVGSAPNRTN